jgi:hypothetical protein
MVCRDYRPPCVARDKERATEQANAELESQRSQNFIGKTSE